MSDQPVQIFTISTCIHCTALKKMLDQHKIPYEFNDVDLLPKQERESLIASIIKYNEKKTFPLVFIGNKAIIGFQEQVIKNELGLE